MFFVSSTGEFNFNHTLKCSFCALAMFAALFFAPVLSAKVLFSPYSDDVFREQFFVTLGQDEFEEDLEDDLEEDIEDDIEEDIEDDIEDDIEEDIEDDIEEDIEEDIEDDIEEDIEEDVEENIEEDIEADVEENIEEDVEEDMEEVLDEEFDEVLEDELDEEFDDVLEDQLDEEFDEDFEELGEEDFEELDEEDFDELGEEDFDELGEEDFDELDEEDFDELGEEDFEELDEGYDQEYQQDAGDDWAELDERLDNWFEKGIAFDDDSYADNYDAVMEAQIEAVEERAVNAVDEFGHEIWTNGWLVFADDEQQQQLQSMGYQVLKREELEAIGQTLVTVVAPASFSLPADSLQAQGEIIRQQLDSMVVMADANHVYSYQQSSLIQQTVSKTNSYQPAKLLNHVYQSNDNNQVTIGMLDTAVAHEHEALKIAHQQGNIVQKSFVAKGKVEPTGHGTQIAGILLGQSSRYQGLVEGGRLLAASVFFAQDARQGTSGDIATTRALLMGLNWLAQQQVAVINMSLTGPPNKLLAFTIDKLCQQGIVIVAAVGNEGPLSGPLFPAGYPCTVAVTAVDVKQNI